VPSDTVQKTAKMINLSGKRLVHSRENILLYIFTQTDSYITSEKLIRPFKEKIATEIFISVAIRIA
jgi:hypothetical protein